MIINDKIKSISEHLRKLTEDSERVTPEIAASLRQEVQEVINRAKGDEKRAAAEAIRSELADIGAEFQGVTQFGTFTRDEFVDPAAEKAIQDTYVYLAQVIDQNPNVQSDAELKEDFATRINQAWDNNPMPIPFLSIEVNRFMRGFEWESSSAPQLKAIGLKRAHLLFDGIDKSKIDSEAKNWMAMTLIGRPPKDMRDDFDKLNKTDNIQERNKFLDDIESSKTNVLRNLSGFAAARAEEAYDALLTAGGRRPSSGPDSPAVRRSIIEFVRSEVGEEITDPSFRFRPINADEQEFKKLLTAMNGRSQDMKDYYAASIEYGDDPQDKTEVMVFLERRDKVWTPIYSFTDEVFQF
ncbi:MAG: hypothetical protein R3C68_09410 [Myxococcota bacterium]